MESNKIKGAGGCQPSCVSSQVLSQFQPSSIQEGTKSATEQSH